MVVVAAVFKIGNNNRKMAAGLGKLFRPVAPSTVRSISTSKKRAEKCDKGSANRGDESFSETSSVRVRDSDAVPPAQWAHKQEGEVIPPEFRQQLHIGGERPGTSHQQQQRQESVSDTSEWSQLPGSIPDPEENHTVDIIVRQKTPPNNENKSRSVLNGNAIKPEDIDNVPQPSKQFVRDVRAKRVMKEYRAVLKMCNRPNSIFSVELVEDNLFEWNVKLFEVDQLSLLHYDMEKRDIPFILFNLSFPDNFPFTPPFVRVVSPKIDNGYVMDGGAICMELLTPGGWSSAYTVEAIVMQLGATLVAGQARLSRGKRYLLFGEVPFNKQEAMDSFKNIIETHKKYGWHTPAGDFS
ncbi:uncharacterized protein [Amphiura filiformis]|uniref:uncharacterized protein n=1 Tax=Amphiura filiformis TaxID=82378 RepID=UPI003B213AB9